MFALEAPEDSGIAWFIWPEENFSGGGCILAFLLILMGTRKSLEIVNAYRPQTSANKATNELFNYAMIAATRTQPVRLCGRPPAVEFYRIRHILPVRGRYSRQHLHAVPLFRLFQ